MKNDPFAFVAPEFRAEYSMLKGIPMNVPVDGEPLPGKVAKAKANELRLRGKAGSSKVVFALSAACKEAGLDLGSVLLHKEGLDVAK